MTTIYHLNCVEIGSPVVDNVCGHCLLLQENDKLILIDTGIGLLDIQQPIERMGQRLIDRVGYRFNEDQTAYRQIQKLGLDPTNVTDCIISHLDNDHIGGLADFPNATVHVSIEELQNFNAGNHRYLKTLLAHNPIIKTYRKSDFSWFGFEARKVKTKIETEIYLIPLFGHTFGHCGVAMRKGSGWLFYVADAYYKCLELNSAFHPVKELAKMQADDNNLRLSTLNKIKSLIMEHPDIQIFSYHDIEEYEFYQSKSLLSSKLCNSVRTVQITSGKEN